MTSYSKRESILEGLPRVWRIEPDALVQILPGGELRLPWNKVCGVRLRYAPTEMKSWRHVFTIEGPSGISMSFDNGHYVSVGVFEDRSAAFSSFIGAVLDKVAEHAPSARVYLGSTPMNYAALLAGMMIPMAFLCWVILTVPIPGMNPESNILLLRLLVIAAMLPIAGRWMVKARPRRATLQILMSGLP